MPDFTFDKRKRTYFKDGRPVKPETLKAWVAEVMERTREGMANATQGFIDGGTNRAAWTLEMRALISRSHGALWMLAQGGKEMMDERAWGAAGSRVKTQLDYLRGFERDLANGKAGTDAQILARASLYASPLHQTYQAAVVAREKAAGVQRVARVLDPGSQSCEDCPALVGEYDIDSVPEIGDSTSCGAMCRCEIVTLEAA
jgi:hypothetical protein